MKTIIFRLTVFLYVFCAMAQAGNMEMPIAASPLPAYFSHGVVDLKKSVAAAQDSFEETYLQTLLNNEKFFDDAYNNNLVITSEIDWDFAQNGVVFMKLIDFLEKKDGSDAKLMLTKLNELFYLLFHRHLSHLELPREKQVEAIRALHYLFNFKDGQGNAVLRSHLTRVLIYTMMVEVLGLHYYEKKEVVFFALEDFRAALKFSAASVANNATALCEIETFINILAAYGMKEPVIKPHNFKKWIVIFSIVAAIVGICYYIGTWDRFKELVNDLVKSTTEVFSKTVKDVLIEPGVDMLVDKLEKKGPALGKALGDGAAEAISDRGAELGEKLGNGFKETAADLGEKLGKGFKKTAAGLGTELGKGFKETAADLGTELGEGLLEGIANENPKRKAPKGRRPNRNLAKIVGKGRDLADDAIDDLADVAAKVRLIGGGIPDRAKRRADRAAARAKEARGDDAGDAEGDEDGEAGDEAAPKRSARGARPRRGGRRAAPKPAAVEEEDDEVPEDDAPKPRRSARRGAAPGDEGGGDARPAPKPKRGGRGRGKGAASVPADESEGGDEREDASASPKPPASRADEDGGHARASSGDGAPKTAGTDGDRAWYNPVRWVWGAKR